MLERLANRIWSHATFHSEFAALQRHSLTRRIVGSETDDGFDLDALTRLLEAATTLAASPRSDHREAAFRIVVAASDWGGEALPGINYVTLLSMSRLGNFPAMDHARRRFGISEEALPARELAENTLRIEQNVVRFGKQEAILTVFQKSLWDQLNASDTLGISAPTSAGKSFVLQGYARACLSDGRAQSVAFIVPSRALINQVSDDVSEWLGEEDVNVELITTPISRDTQLPARALYVLTQERLQLLQIAHEALKIDVMFVDEAQSLGAGPRGVLLSSVIEESIRRNESMKLFFAGPNLSDPGNLASMFGRAVLSVATQEASVVQNIFFVDVSDENARKAKLYALIEQDKVFLSEIETDQPLLDHKSKLINIALSVAAGGQSLLYAMGAAECENIATGLCDGEELTPSPEQEELSSFIKDAVHPKFYLAQAVKWGVGYHYGRMPSLVRKAIEDAVSEGMIQYLVTTSTLLFGVNLPARNLFLHNPQTGQNQPISPTDFWNLAGRAGRLGKEFAGNIFLIDYGSWGNDPMGGPKEKSVTPTLTRHVVDEAAQLVAYIQDPDVKPLRDKADEYENSFTKLTQSFIAGNLEETLARVGLQEGSPFIDEIKAAIAGAVKDKNINYETLSKSPTVSIHRQQSLYDRLDASYRKKGAAYVLPKHPMDSNAYNSLIACIKRCHDEVLKYDKKDKSYKYFAPLALKWMRGQPLPMIIDGSYEFRNNKGEEPSWPSVIRAVMQEIENDLRFKYVRLFSCYNAVLELVFRNHKRGDLVASIPAIPMYLEVGACSATMMSFMGLGLSRFTAGKLKDFPRRQDMSQAEARAWLRRQPLESLDLPSASRKEIRRLNLAG